MARQELAWTNITRADLPEGGQEAWDAYVEAKEMLELAIGEAAVASGSAGQGDTFAFSYARWSQGSVGLAIKAQGKAQTSGFAGLKKPTDARETEARKLADYLEERRASGRRV